MEAQSSCKLTTVLEVMVMASPEEVDRLASASVKDVPASEILTEGTYRKDIAIIDMSAIRSLLGHSTTDEDDEVSDIMLMKILPKGTSPEVVKYLNHIPVASKLLDSIENLTSKLCTEPRAILGKEDYQQILISIETELSDIQKYFENLMLYEKRLDEKIEYQEKRKRVTPLVFIFGFFIAVMTSIVSVAIDAPPVLPAVSGALAVPIVSVGKWCDVIWNGHFNETKSEKDLISSMTTAAYDEVVNLTNIYKLLLESKSEADQLLILPSHIEAHETETKSRKLMESMKYLRENAFKRRSRTIRAWNAIKKKITTYYSKNKMSLCGGSPFNVYNMV